jgi:hypothetical protein
MNFQSVALSSDLKLNFAHQSFKVIETHESLQGNSPKLKFSG